MTEPSPFAIRRFSSRRQRLDHSFLAERLRGARAYDRIAGYFSSSLLELVGEELDSVTGPIRGICNSDLDPLDVQTAKAAQEAGVLQPDVAKGPRPLLTQRAEPAARPWLHQDAALKPFARGRDRAYAAP